MGLGFAGLLRKHRKTLQIPTRVKQFTRSHATIENTSPKGEAFSIAGVGFEPTTSRLWAWRAAKLLYPAKNKTLITKTILHKIRLLIITMILMSLA